MNRFDPEGTATPVEEALELRVHGDPARPTLVYLPGLHGDWTLIGRFRRALGDTARFVEMTYPRTLTWSLDEYAQRIEAALAGRGISSGWLLGESFGSQLAWALLARGKFKADGVILAGGFVRHPAVWGVRAAARLTAGISLSLITRILFGYARLARARHLRNPEIMQEISDFISRRTEQD
ncbi:MAG TPA: hypothetical protein VHH88_03950, partial [Verrucomicrobiae bacterium]|nr:hypothetical protein [Verrucomicrobiae bacterium]